MLQNRRDLFDHRSYRHPHDLVAQFLRARCGADEQQILNRIALIQFLLDSDQTWARVTVREKSVELSDHRIAVVGHHNSTRCRGKFQHLAIRETSRSALSGGQKINRRLTPGGGPE